MMLVRLVLTTTLFLLVLGIRNSTSQLRDELVATTKDRQAVDKAHGGNNARIKRHVLRGIEEGKAGCNSDKDCSLKEICVGHICQDSCRIKNPCAAHAVCINTNHGTDCSCEEGYHGNAFSLCSPDEAQDHRQGRTAFNTESPTLKAKREQVFRNRLAVRRRQALTRSVSPKSHLNSTLKSSLNNSQDLLEVQETRHSVYVTAPSDLDLDDQPTLDEESEKEEEDHSTIGSLSRNSSPKNGSLIQSSQMRKKNTVVMPESLYNHFRPVESNIPIEDMTQFRYFGQKIRPENTTSNNSVEVTSTSASPMQRRRFFIKGFSTTATPSSKLEEMINEEMNIAVDKSTVEKNKIPKTKNLLRGTNLYLRKSQRSDSLPANVTAKNGSIEGNSVQLDIASNDVTLRTLALNDTKDESLILKIEKPKSSPVRSKKTGVSQTGNNKEEKGLMMPSESSQVLGRISTWLSINVDPMTPSMDRENVGTSSSSLRIVVTEIPAVSELTGNSSGLEPVNIVAENVVTLVPSPSTSTSTSSSSSSSILTTTLTPTTTAATVTDNFTSATGIPNEETPVALAQQMHPYAYTITNVTRLLGNYSGPRSNDNPSLTTLKEQVNSWFSPPLVTSGMGLLHSTRTPGPVSVASTAVEHSATTEQSTPLTAAALLVGETFNDTTLQQQVAAYSVHRNTSQASTVVPISTDNPAVVSVVVGSSNSNSNFNPNSTEPTRTSAEEKGHLKKVTDEEKTIVSAIVDKEVTNDRKLFRSTTPSAVSSERKEADQNLPRSTTPESVERKSILKLTTESGEKVLDKKEVNDRRLLRKSASAVLNQRITGEESVRDSKRRRSDIRSGSRNTKGRVDERVGSRSIDGKDEVIQLVDSTNNSYNIGSIMANSSIIGESGANSGSGLPVVGEGQKFEGVKLNLSEPVKGNGESDSETGFGDSKLVSSTVKTLVFPVTPMILDDKDKEMEKGEDQEVAEKIEETAKAPDRPFGIAKDLDPSEIQKMYRSQTTLKPEGTTLLETNLVTSPQTPKMEAKKNGERSPEVRGRNLSDKTKDKDDVLPIMHLYNTSDIFNGTMKDLENRENRTVEVKTGEENMSVKGRNKEAASNSTAKVQNSNPASGSFGNKTRHKPVYFSGPEPNGYHQVNSSFYEPGIIPVTMRDPINMSEVITKRHDGDTLATQETVVIVSYILAGLVFFPIVVGVVLIFRRLIIKNRKVLEESDTSSEISCRKDALNLENGDFKTSIEKAITKLPRIQHLCHEAEKPPPPAKQESRWEFPRDKLRLQTVLGQGNFGQVWKAEADDLTGHKGTTRLVAVKTVKEGASAREKEDLVRELEIMQQLGNHPNVVTLLGCCTEEEPHYLILEYVMYGKLLAYLRDHRTRQDFYNFSEDSAALTSRDLTVFGYCVARGMEYLASKKIIHRDLAARNVLVDHNKLCKIADFGMSRFANEDGECIETRHGRNALPIRWMAPESLIYSLFTTKTDVWSFGILMWEIVTLGSTPYPDMAAREVMRNVQDGYRLERPSHCRSELFRVIARCWHADPDRRPEFQLLRRDLAQLLEDNMNGHYVDLESYASECTD